MFDSLKKKLKSFFGKEEKKKKSTKKPKTKIKKTKNIEQDLQELAQEVKTEVPQAFKPGTLAYEPDSEAIKEKGEEQKKGNFFTRFTEKFTAHKITGEHIEAIFSELEMILLEHNVALEVVDAIKERLVADLVNKEVKKSEIQKRITNSLVKAIESVLQEPQKTLLDQIRSTQGTFTILFFGINGSGKTTSLAKLANYLKKNKISCVMAAADTFRAASIEQLETHGTRLGIPVIKHTYGSDPAAVAFDAKKYAEKNHVKVVLIDTAGRMYTRDNLMKEMEKIVRIAQPNLKFFVGESITGNDATEQARMFNETAGIDGIILTKADVDDKGGTALSVSQVTHKPIYFLGVGQSYDDFKPFKKDEILKNLGLES